MGKPARVITWSSDNFAYGNDRDSVLKQLRDQLASSAWYHPDLVCFTEESMLSCGDEGWVESNAMALEIFREGARSLGSNVVCCLEEPSRIYPGRSYNTVYFINRDGASATSPSVPSPSGASPAGIWRCAIWTSAEWVP